MGDGRGPTAKQRWCDDLVTAGMLAKITGSAAKVLWALRNRMDAAGHCYMGNRRLAAEAGIGDSTLPSAREQLRREGLVDAEVRPTRFADGAEGEVYHYQAVPVSEEQLARGRAAMEGRIAKARARDREKKHRQRADAASLRKPGGCPAGTQERVPPKAGGKPCPAQNPGHGTPPMKREKPTLTGKPVSTRAARVSHLAEYFRCALCDSGLGRACTNPDHLGQELEGFGMEKADVIVARYPGTEIRRQLAAARFLLDSKPQKINRPQERLACAIRDRYALPTELQSVWDRLMAEEARRREQAEAERRAEWEAEAWGPFYEKLEGWRRSLSDAERRAFEQEVAEWTVSAGRSWAASFEQGAPIFEGQNRKVAVRFLQRQRPALADEMGVK